MGARIHHDGDRQLTASEGGFYELKRSRDLRPDVGERPVFD